jgi:hypothetical protein
MVKDKERVRYTIDVDVLNKIHFMPGDSQPRILGLTASPFAAGSLLEVSWKWLGIRKESGTPLYVDVLNKIHLMPGDSQPRILGLTASPFAAGSLLVVSWKWLPVGIKREASTVHHCMWSKIHLMPGDTRPRIIGLTASPITAGSLLEISGIHLWLMRSTSLYSVQLHGNLCTMIYRY